MHRLPEAIRGAVKTIKIPSPPEVLLRLMRTLDDDNATVSDVAALVGQDPNLTSRILAVANSAALNRGQRLDTLDACLMALGMRLVRTLATCISIQSVFEKDTVLSAVEVADFWGNSLLVAEFARDIAEQIDFEQPSHAYLVGLLHNVGELILSQVLGESYQSFIASFHHHPQLVNEEQVMFGVTHAEVGAWFVAQWNLDSTWADSVAFHHAATQEIGQATTLPQVVWLAQVLTQPVLQTSEELDALLAQLPLKIGAGWLLEARERAIVRTKQIADALGMQVTAGFPQRARYTPSVSVIANKGSAEQGLAALLGPAAVMHPLQECLQDFEHVEDVLQAIQESFFILFELQHTAILLRTPDGEQLRGVGAKGQATFLSSMKLVLGSSHSLLVEAAKTRQSQSCFTHQAPLSLIDRQVVRALGTDGFVCWPLVAAEAVIGVLLVGVDEEESSLLEKSKNYILKFLKISAESISKITKKSIIEQALLKDADERIKINAAQLAHEVGNPLGIIKSYLRILKKKISEENIGNEFTVLEEEINRVSNIFESSGKSGECVDIKNSISRILIDLDSLYSEALFLSKNIHFELIVPEHDVLSNFENGALKQIILNLWKNASEALKSGDQLKVLLQDEVWHNGKLFSKIQIKDNGPGIPSEKLDGLFEEVKFYAGQKRGMGLSLVGKLAKQEGMLISAHSQSGLGTDISIFVPKNDNKKVVA